jgi:L-amino acid N-acyltransferase YncA
MIIRDIEEADINSVTHIYNHYIKHTTITFEEVEINSTEMAARIQNIQSLFPFLVCENTSVIVGYAYASKWKDRSAYRHTAEVTIYLHPDHLGKKIGQQLYAELFNQLQQKNLHVLLACIAIPNHASVGLHEKFGFKQAAHFEAVGFKFNRWLNVGYWAKTINEKGVENV